MMQYNDDRNTRMERNGKDYGAIYTRSVHIDFPKYDGNDHSGWLCQASQFFYFHKTAYD